VSVVALGLSEHGSATAAAHESGEILRFRASERHLHWAIAVPFKVCYATALILVTVYNPHPARPFRELVSWIHRVSGVCLAVLPLATIIWHRHDFAMHLQNVRRAWSWSIADIKWLFLMGPATVNKRIELPHQDKFNAAEKINFMVLTATYPMYVGTGLTIWFFSPAFVAWLVHFSLATIATPLILGHIFMATVNPDTRIGLSGMITGFVDRHWAMHHYRLWYDELFGRAAPARAAVQPATRTAPKPAVAPAVRAAAPIARPHAAAPPVVRRPSQAAPMAVPRPVAAAQPASADTEWILRPMSVPGSDGTRWGLRPVSKEPARPIPTTEADPSFAS
jgi:formate dehydrogenase subunit gamma